LKRRDFLKAGIGGAFALWGLGAAMQEKTAMAAGDPMPEAMDMLLKITDEGHLLYGSDFPYVPAKALLGKKAALDNELANRQWLVKIYCQNSQELIFS